MNFARRRFAICIAIVLAVLLRTSAGFAQSREAHQLNGKAIELYQAGRYTEAIAAERQAVELFEKSPGSNNRDLAQSLNNLAETYRIVGRDAEAEPILKRALPLLERAFGADNPNMVYPLNNLALLYTTQGRYGDAEPLFKRSLAILEKARGVDQRNIAHALDNLAVLYKRQGRYTDAESMYKRALALYEKLQGPEHPDVADVLDNLALLYGQQDRSSEAESLVRRALVIQEKALGPDHPAVAISLNNLALMEVDLGHLDEAEPLMKRALAIRERMLGPDNQGNREIAEVLNNLAALCNKEDRYADALPLVRRTMSNGAADTSVALPTFFGAQRAGVISADEALEDGLNVKQRASQTSASEALNELAVRFAAGNDRLAELVRKDQDLAAEAAHLDKAIIAAVSTEPSRRNAAKEQSIRDRTAVIARERSDLQAIFTREFPDYAALSKPEPLPVKETQALLAADEAVIVVDLESKDFSRVDPKETASYVWAITRDKSGWMELAVNTDQVSQFVARLRAQLNVESPEPFDAKLSFDLYRQVLGPVENIIGSKPRWSLVLDGPLTGLPPQVLVTGDPAGKALKDLDWAIRKHAITVLPSVASLRVLRSKAALAEAEEPLIGFADPVFDKDVQRLQQNSRAMADLAAARGTRGAVADVSALRKALPALPSTALELKKVATSVKARLEDIILGADATEARVKQSKLDRYRIVYFATHGLLAGQVADFAKLNAEPALVLSLPETPTDLDDGLLTASEVAQLKLNADWVVLSACNTAAGDKPGAEALSGLARAFFYAGGRSLLVSHWEVETDSAVELMTGTFAALAADPALSHGEALRQSMLGMITHPREPTWYEPRFWAPFVVVGEPAKPAVRAQ